jgi:hypothetical protein
MTATSARRMTRAAFACASIAIGALLLDASGAQATEPGNGDVACLASVLREAPNAISVKPAKDWTYYIAPSQIVRKGVDYTFRQPDGSAQTVGVYLSTEFDLRRPANPPPNSVVMAGSLTLVPSDNHRYALVLRPPYPGRWYPPAREIVDAPNAQRYVRQDSNEHPLYGLWDKLEAKCRIDNQELNGPTP